MYSTTRPDTPIASAPQGAPDPALRQCSVCGQIYDLRKFDQAFHHDDQPHEPLIERADAI